MKLPLSWINEYINIELPANELAHLLTLAGTEVSGIKTIGEWSKVIVSKITKIEPHPNADKLKLVTVDTGTLSMRVVCGANNLFLGQKIAFAPTGSMLFNPKTGKEEKLKKAKIRNVESNGMICSSLELGIGDDHQGIYEVNNAIPIGTLLKDILKDTIFDLDITPNRSDCLSMYGIAREISAITGKKLKINPYDVKLPISNNKQKEFSLKIEDPNICSRYMGALIKGVTIEESPDWLKERLIKIGEKPVNNIVDITNYVMFELGQPLHAFDFKFIEGKNITVRKSSKDEKIITIDNESRKLEEVVVISDIRKPIAVAGVMGGKESEITVDTQDVFLESACFDSVHNRESAKNLGMKTEATLRFEKGLNPKLCEFGIKRSLDLIIEIAGGNLEGSVQDLWIEDKNKPNKINISQEKINNVLGIDFDPDIINKTFLKLGFLVTEYSKGNWNVTVPFWRQDISIPEDLCEELARIIGYEKIPTSTLSGKIPEWEPDEYLNIRENLRDILVESGMQEVITYAADSKESQLLTIGTKNSGKFLKILNPMSRDFEYLRLSLRSGILKTVSKNIRIWREPLRIFELGNIFEKKSNDLPNIKEMICGAFVGNLQENIWTTPRKLDFFDVKGTVQYLFEKFQLHFNLELTIEENFIPGKCFNITSNGIRMGIIGEIDSNLLNKFDIKNEEVILFELELDKFIEHSEHITKPVSYNLFSKYQESTRDLDLIINKSVLSQEILDEIKTIKLIKNVEIFDVFQAKNLPNNKKSLGIRLIISSDSHTLTSEEIQNLEKKALKKLNKRFGAELRG